MSENTSSPATSATITEQELFREFLRFGYGHFDPFTGAPVVVITPRDFLADGGGYETLRYAFEGWIEELEESDNPADEMECMIDELTYRLDNLKEVRSRYDELQKHRAVESEEHDDARYTPRPASWPGSSEFWTNADLGEEAA